jgi:hypothetical protein
LVQFHCGMRPDEPSSSRYQYFSFEHVVKLIGSWVLFG